MKTETKPLPSEVYALVWSSDYAGDVPADQIVRADLNLDQIRSDPRHGEETYDGTSMRSRGKFVARKFPKPRSIATLERKFGDRVKFAPCQDGYSLGCWIDGQPHRLGEYEWTWKREEYDYLAAYFMAVGLMDTDA